MKKTISNSLLIVSFLCLISCRENYADVTIQKDLISKVDSLSQNITQLKEAVEKNKSQEEIQNSFVSSRLAYKKIEWAIEYFTPEPARFINGPALDELEVEENKFLPPNGFQVIEEIIFPNYNKASKTELIMEINILKGNILQVKRHLEAITISPDYVLDASRAEVHRIISLGITGFDSPIAFNSIQEAKASLESIRNSIEKVSSKKSTSGKRIRDIINKAVAFCNQNPNFSSFDRAIFIKEYLNPIDSQLAAFRKEHKIALVSRNNVIHPESKSIFESNAFNVDAFIPSKEYAFTDEKAKLGAKLFYEIKLSNAENRSCASCHIPEKAFTDGMKTNKSLSGIHLPRNTPTLTYASLQNAQFWDMRQPDLEKQSLDVITNKDEMHGSLKNSIPYISADSDYRVLFLKAFPKSKKIEEWQLQNALASYIRSLNKFNSRFDRYFQSKGNFTEEEKLGFNLFAGKAKCATCHFIPLTNGTVPPMYNKTEQEVLGTPNTKAGLKISDDLGRFSQYKMAQLRNAFKTPTLRNIALTAPYMHNGVYDSLEEVVDFYNKGGGVGLGYDVENQTLPSDKLNLTLKEQKALVAFLKTLSDN